jgi:hypothetical protein
LEVPVFVSRQCDHEILCFLNFGSSFTATTGMDLNPSGLRVRQAMSPVVHPRDFETSLISVSHFPCGQKVSRRSLTGTDSFGAEVNAGMRAASAGHCGGAGGTD